MSIRHPSKHDPILDSITEGGFTVDLEWKVGCFNRAAAQITGITREEAVGRYCFAVRSTIRDRRG